MSAANGSGGVQPFGSPDGARADPKQIVEGFVDLIPGFDDSGLTLDRSQFSVRVIVGRMGAGKTVYMRRQRTRVQAAAEYYADDFEGEPPPTDLVQEVARALRNEPEHIVIDHWRRLWKRAILRSVVSHLLTSPALSTSLSEEDFELLSRDFESILPQSRMPLPIYTHLTQILTSYQGLSNLRNYINDPDWDALEVALRRILPRCPTLCFFIDSIDDAYEQAPSQWQRCQLGLLNQVLRFLKDDVFSNLHVTVTLRDQVLAGLLNSERGMKHLTSPSILTLEWDQDAVRYLLRKKIESLRSRNCIRPTSDLPQIENWLGRTKVEDPSTGAETMLEDYLLHQIRNLPRDVIRLGNLLCEHVRAAQALDAKEVPVRAIRDAVGQVAREAGDHQLTVCANQIAASIFDPQPEYRLEGTELARSSLVGVEPALREFMRASFESPRFTFEAVRRGQEASRAYFGIPGDVLIDSLWRNGMFGFREHGDSDFTYFSLRKSPSLHLPPGMSEYSLHPTLEHALGIRTSTKSGDD